MSNPFESPQFNSPVAVDRTIRLKRLGVVSSGIFGGAAGAGFGLIVGTIVMLAAMAGALENPGGGPAQGTNIVVGVVVLIGAPLGYGLFGFIGGLLNAVIYNLVAGITGGLELEFGER